MSLDIASLNNIFLDLLKGYRLLLTYPGILKSLNDFCNINLIYTIFGSVALQTSPIYRIVQYVKVILKEGIVLTDENTYKNL